VSVREERHETGHNSTDRSVEHDLDRLGALLLSQLGLGDHRLAVSHDLGHVCGKSLTVGRQR
jgi:hypothetical protein